MKNFLHNLVGGGNPGWLFLAYDLDTKHITSVRRIAKSDTRWSDWNRFVDEQVDRAFADPLNIPNERVYAFSYKDIEQIPYLNGSDNDHYIQFVSKMAAVYQLTILECGYAKYKQIMPTELRNKETNYDDYAQYVDQLVRDQNRAVLKYTVENDSKNYNLLYNITTRYLEDEVFIKDEIELLVEARAGLRIFSVLENAFRSSAYVRNGWDIDNYDTLIHTPPEERTGLHYLKAELDKVDIQSGQIYANHPDRDRMLLELTLYVRRYAIPKGWYVHGPEREWYYACVTRLTDANTIAREIVNFSFEPSLTRAQLQYLVRMGTTADTLYRSGVMGDVIMSTPFFQKQFGLDMSQAAGRKLGDLDKLLVDACEKVLQGTLQFLENLSQNEEEPEEQREEALQRIPSVQSQLEQVTQFKEGYDKAQRDLTIDHATQRFKGAALQVASYFVTHPYADDQSQASGVNELISLINNSSNDLELSAWQCDYVVQNYKQFPPELIQRIRTQFGNIPYGKLPEHGDLSSLSLLAKETLTTAMQRLALVSDASKLGQEIKQLADELKDKKETELRLQKEINRLDRQVEQAECRWQRMLDKLNENADGGYRNE